MTMQGLLSELYSPRKMTTYAHRFQLSMTCLQRALNVSLPHSLHRIRGSLYFQPPLALVLWMMIVMMVRQLCDYFYLHCKKERVAVTQLGLSELHNNVHTSRPWHIRRALKRALCIVVSIEHNASIIKQHNNVHTSRPWHIRRALKRALCIVVSIEHNASIIKQFLRITSFLITCYTQCGYRVRVNLLVTDHR